METTTNIPVIIYTESTPNPNTLKFVINRPLYPNDFAEFESIEETDKAPLAKALFSIEQITSVYISNNFVSVAKDDFIDWYELMPKIKSFLKNYIENGLPIIAEDFVKPEKTATNTIFKNDSDIEIKIKTALDKYVKPAVEMDGGNITFVSFIDGKLTVQLQGSCNGCPSSTVTLKQGIENIMKKFIPEVQEVVAENE